MSQNQDKAKLRVSSSHLWVRLACHISEMLRLAPAIVLARSGMILIILVDTVMVGHYAVQELGYLAMGLSLAQPLVVTSLGLIMGTLVLSAYQFGAGKYRQCGHIWRRSIAYAAGFGALSVVLCLFGETFLGWTGQSPELAREGGKVMMILGFGIPGHLIFIASSFFLEGIRRPMPGLIVMALGNIVNLSLNWLFIYGAIEGFPDAAMGAALATSLARWFLAGGMFIYVWNMRDHQVFAVRERAPGGWKAWKQQRKLGYATGTSLAVESASFTTVQQFAGWLGPIPLAAFTVSFYLLVVSFMVAIGFGAATAVRVGIAHGRKDAPDMVLAGWTGLALTVLVTISIGIFIVVFDKILVNIFTDDVQVAALAVPLVFWVAIALGTDGGQAVMANALRGRQDVWVPCIMQTFAFFGIMVPVTWYLMFPMGHGAAGIFQGIWISTTVAMTLLCWRFYRLYRMDMRGSN